MRRGSRSNGKGCSRPPCANVIPWVRYALSTIALRSAKVLGRSDFSPLKSRSYDWRGRSGSSNISSK